MPNRFSFKNLRGGDSGVALLLVLVFLMLLSAITVEFAYNTNITFHMAMNTRDRLQSYYLAESALHFSKTLIKYNKEARQMASKASQKLDKPINTEPLYKMIPINSELLRGLISGEPPSEEGEDQAQKEAAADKLEAARQSLSLLASKQAENFLDFEGNFDANIEALEGKLPLNAFFKLSPTQPEYDRLKNILVFLLLQKPFQALLKNPPKDSLELATQIADYVDTNDAVNEIGGSDRGSEAAPYAGTSLKPKNAKFLTEEELILIPGMTDGILEELKKYVTVYRTIDKINPCLASDDLVRAMILAFIQKRSDVENIRPDDQDRLKKAVEKVKAQCPDTSAMTQALNDVLSLNASSSPGAPPPSSAPGAGGAPGFNSFGSMLTDEENIFKIESTGTVGNAEVKIIEVINASGSNPDQWKELYWRVE